MCLIIAKYGDNKTPVPKHYILNAASNNPHGFGIVGMNPKVPDAPMVVNRTMDMEEAEGYIRQYEALGFDFIAHMRFATAGEKNLANCHPFEIGQDAYLAHNGMINIAQPDKKFSDTWHWAEYMKGLVQAREKVTRSVVRSWFYQLNRDMTRASRFAILGKGMRLLIINPKSWQKTDGIWYSNARTIQHGRTSYQRKYVQGAWVDLGPNPMALRTSGEFKDDAALLVLNRRHDWLSNEIELGTATPSQLTGIPRADFMDYWKRFPMEIADCFSTAALAKVQEQQEDAARRVGELERWQKPIVPAGKHLKTCDCLTCEYDKQQGVPKERNPMKRSFRVSKSGEVEEVMVRVGDSGSRPPLTFTPAKDFLVLLEDDEVKEVAQALQEYGKEETCH